MTLDFDALQGTLPCYITKEHLTGTATCVQTKITSAHLILNRQDMNNAESSTTNQEIFFARFGK